MLHEHLRLSSTNLKGDRPAGNQMRGRLGEEGADDIGAIGAAIQRSDGVAADFAGKRRDIAGRDVREIGDDEIVWGSRGGEGGEEIALEEADAVREAEAGGVFGG